jgi:anti-sigma factor RsiW
VSDHLDDVQLSRLIDGDLSLASREAAIAHVRCCSACAARHDRLVAVAASLRLQPPVAWTAGQTEALLRELPRRQRRGSAAAVVALSLGACVLLVLAAAASIAATWGVVGALVDAGRVLLPLPLAGPGTQFLLVVALVALLAPLAAYPLARWR